MKNINPFLRTIMLIGIVLLFQVKFVRELVNPISEYFPIIWIVFILLSIYEKIKYKKGKRTNQLRIPTNNDDYNRIMPFILGVILSIGGILALKYFESEKIMWTLLFVTGILSLISGFLFIPSGIIETKNNKLSFENGSRKESIGIEKIKNIDLKGNEIILYENNEKVHYINHMNLNESDYKSILEFLKDKLKSEIEIKTFGSKV
ncbi:hypothetical protein KO506_17015 [Polaribacter vadi]|uniref:hypothetical protein n=1 Tax=Polaribacter TaxID=52959 RepID=UPI001C094947|nr:MULTISPECIES: hypothetical protein [Polaribacter]MBU3013116.1 hypothetical protein [Polaribacter vadi]MDO6742936.1 hypothetical protein [Polaribacter sp. 1_MG-2023]